MSEPMSIKTDGEKSSLIRIQPGMTLKSPVSLTSLTDDGILVLRYFDDLDYDLEKAKAAVDFHQRLSIPRPVRMLIITGRGGSMTPEAREYLAKEEHNRYRKAVAVVVNNLAHRLIANFYGKHYPTDYPYRVFQTEEQALQWLRQL
ncbi:MAG: STAS/SEC14 domain-containing protein [Flavobacteriales bacterium]